MEEVTVGQAISKLYALRKELDDASDWYYKVKKGELPWNFITVAIYDALEDRKQEYVRQLKIVKEATAGIKIDLEE